mmetsp:Transcript_38309/g.101428  ORF Transcript_38309/g.101428 Transcript_38309/m.101428 type:complete len:225 (+) Transcript_38309:523-1197(+)
MQRWSMSARIEASQRCPTLCHTRTVEAARSGATISTHMMGNVTPGGVQLGIIRSLKPPVFSPEIAFAKSGRELSSGEKIRERRLMPKKSTKTAQSGGVTAAAAAPASRAARKAAMAASWMATAAPYFRMASVSSSFSWDACLATRAPRLWSGRCCRRASARDPEARPGPTKGPWPPCREKAVPTTSWPATVAQAAASSQAAATLLLLFPPGAMAALSTCDATQP